GPKSTVKSRDYRGCEGGSLGYRWIGNRSFQETFRPMGTEGTWFLFMRDSHAEAVFKCELKIISILRRNTLGWIGCRSASSALGPAAAAQDCRASVWMHGFVMTGAASRRGSKARQPRSPSSQLRVVS